MLRDCLPSFCCLESSEMKCLVEEYPNSIADSFAVQPTAHGGTNGLLLRSSFTRGFPATVRVSGESAHG